MAKRKPGMDEVAGASDAPVGRRERRKREVHARIFGAARELFRKNGFDATTVDEIAEAADVAPATFFNHFQSKQALLGLMTSEVVDTLQVLIANRLEVGDTSQQRLMHFVTSAADEVSANRGIARDVLLEMMRNESTPGGPAPYLARLQEPFVSLVEAGQKSGEIRSDHSAAFLAQMAVGMMNSAISHWLSDPDYPVESGLTQAAEFAWDALRAGRDTDS